MKGRQKQEDADIPRRVRDMRGRKSKEEDEKKQRKTQAAGRIKSPACKKQRARNKPRTARRRKRLYRSTNKHIIIEMKEKAARRAS